MPELFSSVLTSSSGEVSFAAVGICLLASLLLGFVIALLHSYKNNGSKNFLVTLALLPAIVQLIITLVNGNLGTGVAVMGAFSLVRFRSVPGNAREICSLLLAMAVGLATGTGYIAVAACFVIVMGAVMLLYRATRFGESRQIKKTLRVTVPESLDYTGVFDDLFEKYTESCQLVKVKTSGMGSLFKLEYRIVLKDGKNEKAFIDELRCRNGNLEISCGLYCPSASEEL